MFEEGRDFLFCYLSLCLGCRRAFHRLNAAPHGWCKQGMFPLLLSSSLQSPCGLRTLGVRLSPCCSIRAHLWQLIAERLLETSQTSQCGGRL